MAKPASKTGKAKVAGKPNPYQRLLNASKRRLEKLRSPTKVHPMLRGAKRVGVTVQVSIKKTDRSPIKCPACNRTGHAYDELAKHIRIVHGRELSADELKMLMESGATHILRKGRKLGDLKLISRKMRSNRTNATCDYCRSIGTCWRFGNTTRGPCTLCEKCIDKVRPPRSTDLMDRGRRTSGSFEGAPTPPKR